MEIFLPGKEEPVKLLRDSAALHLVQRVRDEAHRFAVAYHRNLRAKGSRESFLDGIRCIGPARKTKILRYLAGLADPKAVPAAGIAQAANIPLSLATAIAAKLNTKDVL